MKCTIELCIIIEIQIFQNALTPPTFLFKPNTTMNYHDTMTADEATMNIIIWIHVFPS